MTNKRHKSKIIPSEMLSTKVKVTWDQTTTVKLVIPVLYYLFLSGFNVCCCFAPDWSIRVEPQWIQIDHLFPLLCCAQVKWHSAQEDAILNAATGSLHQAALTGTELEMSDSRERLWWCVCFHSLDTADAHTEAAGCKDTEVSARWVGVRSWSLICLQTNQTTSQCCVGII